MDSKYKISISGPEVSIDKETSDDTLVKNIISILFSFGSSPVNANSPVLTTPLVKGMRPTNKKTRGHKPVSVVRPEVEDLQITSVPETYKAYWNELKTKADKVLLLLALAKDAGIEELNTSEVARLARKVNDKIEAKNVMGILIAHSKAGKVFMDTKNGFLKLRISEEGIRYLKK